MANAVEVATDPRLRKRLSLQTGDALPVSSKRARTLTSESAISDSPVSLQSAGVDSERPVCLEQALLLNRVPRAALQAYARSNVVGPGDEAFRTFLAECWEGVPPSALKEVLGVIHEREKETALFAQKAAEAAQRAALSRSSGSDPLWPAKKKLIKDFAKTVYSKNAVQGVPVPSALELFGDAQRRKAMLADAGFSSDQKFLQRCIESGSVETYAFGDGSTWLRALPKKAAGSGASLPVGSPPPAYLPAPGVPPVYSSPSPMPDSTGTHSRSLSPSVSPVKDESASMLFLLDALREVGCDKGPVSKEDIATKIGTMKVDAIKKHFGVNRLRDCLVKAEEQGQVFSVENGYRWQLAAKPPSLAPTSATTLIPSISLPMRKSSSFASIMDVEEDESPSATVLSPAVEASASFSNASVPPSPTVATVAIHQALMRLVEEMRHFPGEQCALGELRARFGREEQERLFRQADLKHAYWTYLIDEAVASGYLRIFKAYSGGPDKLALPAILPASPSSALPLPTGPRADRRPPALAPLHRQEPDRWSSMTTFEKQALQPLCRLRVWSEEPWIEGSRVALAFYDLPRGKQLMKSVNCVSWKMFTNLAERYGLLHHQMFGSASRFQLAGKGEDLAASTTF